MTDWKVGDHASHTRLAFNRPSPLLKVTRVTKTSFETEDGSKWTHGGQRWGNRNSSFDRVYRVPPEKVQNLKEGLTKHQIIEEITEWTKNLHWDRTKLSIKDLRKVLNIIEGVSCDQPE